MVELFEEILKQQRQKLTSQLQTFVAVVITVILSNDATLGQDHTADHECQVCGFDLEVPVWYLIYQ